MPVQSIVPFGYQALGMANNMPWFLRHWKLCTETSVDTSTPFAAWLAWNVSARITLDKSHIKDNNIITDYDYVSER